QRRDFVGVEHRAAWWASRVAHVAVPVLAGAAHANRFSVIGDVGQDDDLRAAGHTPALAEDVELYLAEAPGEHNLLPGGDPLIAEKDDAIFVVRLVNYSEYIVVRRLRKIDAADFRAQGSTGWNDF